VLLQLMAKRLVACRMKSVSYKVNFCCIYPSKYVYGRYSVAADVEVLCCVSAESAMTLLADFSTRHDAVVLMGLHLGITSHDFFHLQVKYFKTFNCKFYKSLSCG
jgi:hypothetical protein